MACQSFDRARNRFFLDLHGVLKRDAGRVIRKRLQECCRYGIDSIEVVYGTPDFYDGSIASTLHEVITGDARVILSRLPREFLDTPEQYTQRVAKTVLSLEREPAAHPRDEAMSFTPFPASREPDVWLRRMCENPFFPLREWLTPAEAAQFIGEGCRAADIPHERVSMNQLEALCRSWKRPASAVAQPPVEGEPQPEPPEPELSSGQKWERAWAETAEALALADYARARVKLESCLELSAQDPDSILLARTLGALGDLQGRKNQGAAAEAYYHSSLAAFDSAVTPYSEGRLEVEGRLVQTLMAEGRLAEVAAIWRSARERLAVEQYPNPAQSVYVLSSEAAIRARLDDLDGAAKLLAQAVEVAEHSPALPPITGATLRLHFGSMQATRGDLRGAVAQLSKAAEELDLCDAPAAQRTLCARELAVAAAELGYRGRPEALLRELLAYPTANEPTGERERIRLLSDLSNILFRQERWSDAEACNREALQIAAAHPEDFSLEIFMIREDLGSIYTHLGRYEQAEQEFQATLRLAAQSLPAHHNAVAHCKQNLAVLYTRTARYEEARALHEEALLTLETYFNGPHPDTARAHMNYGALLADMRHWTEAESHLRQAMGMEECIFGAQSPQLGRALTSLGEVLMDQRKYTQARPVLQRAVDVLESSGSERMLLAEAYSALGRVQLGMGNAKAAEKSQRRADYYGWLERPGSH